MRLIDADALEKKLEQMWNVDDDWDFANKDVWHALKDAPTIEPEKKAPILKKGESVACVDYADGDGTILRKKWLDWVCPNCGWFVGEQYVPRRHNQSKSNFCSKCGQAIDWDAVEPERLERVCKWKKQMQLEEIKKSSELLFDQEK